MVEDKKESQKEFKSCCEGVPFAEMMRKMMGAKDGHPFKCAEMISQMIQICSAAREKKEEPAQGTKENPAPNQ